MRVGSTVGRAVGETVGALLGACQAVSEHAHGRGGAMGASQRRRVTHEEADNCNWAGLAAAGCGKAGRRVVPCRPPSPP